MGRSDQPTHRGDKGRLKDSKSINLSRSGEVPLSGLDAHAPATPAASANGFHSWPNAGHQDFAQVIREESVASYLGGNGPSPMGPHDNGTQVLSIESDDPFQVSHGSQDIHTDILGNTIFPSPDLNFFFDEPQILSNYFTSTVAAPMSPHYGFGQGSPTGSRGPQLHSNFDVTATHSHSTANFSSNNGQPTRELAGGNAAVGFKARSPPTSSTPKLEFPATPPQRTRASISLNASMGPADSTILEFDNNEVSIDAEPMSPGTPYSPTPGRPDRNKKRPIEAKSRKKESRANQFLLERVLNSPEDSKARVLDKIPLSYRPKDLRRPESSGKKRHDLTKANLMFTAAHLLLDGTQRNEELEKYVEELKKRVEELENRIESENNFSDSVTKGDEHIQRWLEQPVPVQWSGAEGLQVPRTHAQMELDVFGLTAARNVEFHRTLSGG